MTDRGASSERAWRAVLLASCASSLLHLLVVPLVGRLLPVARAPEAMPVRVTILEADADSVVSLDDRPEPDQPAPDLAPPEPAPPAPRARQLVEIAPTDQTKPEDADYLAELDSSVEHQTRAERYKINPEVVAPAYSDDVKVEEKSGETEAPPDAAPGAPAQTVPEVDLPGPGPPRTRLPSRWLPASPPGLGNPTSAAALGMPGAGAPQNDLLREDVGDAVALDALAYPGAKYLNHIRRQVNFYWTQQIDNLPRSLAPARSRYKTHVGVVLDGDGALVALAVTRPSDEGRIDECVRRAFTMAAPFGAPPSELLDPDGRMRLPEFSFTLEFVRELGP